MYLILYSENNLYNEMKKEGCQDWKPHRTRVKPHASFPTKIAPHCDGCSFPRILSCLLCLFNTLTTCHDPCRDIRTSANKPSANGRTPERELTRSQLSFGYKRSYR